MTFFLLNELSITSWIYFTFGSTQRLRLLMFSDAVKDLFTSVIFLNAAEKNRLICLIMIG